jgi:hypothetical protein
MKKFLIVAVALLTMLAFVGGVVAQEKKEAPAPVAPEKAAPKAPAQGKAIKFTGTVSAYDAAAKTLIVKAKKKEKEFTIADNAKIKGNLKEGKKVVVKYKKEGDKNVATSVAPAGKKAAKKTTKKA